MEPVTPPANAYQGGIDSDMTRRERLERKAETRREWAEGRNGKADALRAQDPPGLRHDWAFITQPGRIPERARMNRRDDKRIEHHKMAAHHTSKAAGIEQQLERSVFSDDDDAIEKLEQRIAEREAERTKNNAINKIVRRKPKNEKTGEKVASLRELGFSQATADGFFVPDFGGRVGVPSYVNQNLGGNIGSDKKRIETIEARARRAQAADDAGGVLITEHGKYSAITFAEKPAWTIRKALKDAGFSWGGGNWSGLTANIPEEVTS